MELINPFDHEALKQKIQNADPFPHFCIDNFLNEEFANEVYNSFPSFQEAEKIGFQFNAINEKKKIQITDSTKFPPAILKLHELLASDEFVSKFSDLFGIPHLIADPELSGGGIHETNSGGRLDVHVDFNYIPQKNYHRRVNILIYFNKDWKDEYGGQLDIWDKDVKNCKGAFTPVFNRACGFATSEISWHGVTPLTCPPDIYRKSFATYFYTKEAPAGWDGTKHSTIFKARPDEWMRGKVLMPTESSLKGLESTWGKFKQGVKKSLNL
jgi:Rps23 Pro-64 3,4-dihydroxylase Tpa1-like proline 4-hydroxylase